MNPPRIAVIIVNWNNLPDTLACLDSLQQCSLADIKIIVVDNASTDGSADVIAAKRPEITIIRNRENLGFTGGNNAGMKVAFNQGADYAFLINNDAEITNGSMETLVGFMETHPEAWASAPLIYYYSQPNIIWSAGGVISWKKAWTKMIGTDEENKGQFGDAPYQVDYATGCALMVRRTALEKFGLLDERFFMYYEEVEWCTRMRKNGQLIYVVPHASVLHKIMSQTRNESPFVHYFMTRNRILWMKLSGFGPQVFLRVFIENLRTLLSWTLRPRWRNKKKLRKAMIWALWDAISKQYGVAPWNKRLVKI